jgi:hypothetical protein
MIEPQSVQAGESAVSNTTGAWPAASRSVLASPFCANRLFLPGDVYPPTGMLVGHGCLLEPVAELLAAA